VLQAGGGTCKTEKSARALTSNEQPVRAALGPIRHEGWLLALLQKGCGLSGHGKLQTEISQASWTPVNAHGLVDCKWHDEMVRFAPPHRCNSAHKSVGCKCVAHTLFCQHKSAFEKEAV